MLDPSSAGARARRRPPRAVLLFAAAILAQAPASGQGFLVRPMILEIKARPGSTIEQALEVRNAEAAAATIAVTAMGLAQGNNGAWRAVPGAGASAGGGGAAPSCLEWLSLPAAEFAVGPLQTVRPALVFRVPLDASGTHGAALLVESRPRAAPGALALVVRFLIPVLIDVQGTAAQRRVECLDARLERGGDGGEASGASVVLDLANTGQTLALLGGQVAVLHQQGGERWLPVTEVEVEETRIIPGASFPLRIDLERSLPPGTYRLDAMVTVDGQPVKPLRRELAFAGDPRAALLPGDAELLLDPSLLEVAGAAGAVRRAILTVRNPGSEALDIACSLRRPAALGGVRLGETLGEEYSCHAWTTLSPERFTLPAGGQRQITLQLAYPREGELKPSSFATLELAASRPGGQRAGSAAALVVARDTRQRALSRLQPAGLSIARESSGRYAIVAAFANTGETPLEPTCQGHLSGGSGVRGLGSIKLTRRAGIVLPLETARFSGYLEVGGIEPGLYIVTAAADCDGEPVEQSLPLRVSDGAGERLVEVVRGAQ